MGSSSNKKRLPLKWMVPPALGILAMVPFATLLYVATDPSSPWLAKKSHPPTENQILYDRYAWIVYSPLCLLSGMILLHRGRDKSDLRKHFESDKGLLRLLGETRLPLDERRALHKAHSEIFDPFEGRTYLTFGGRSSSRQR